MAVTSRKRAVSATEAPAFVAIQSEAAAVGWPVHFESDLVHDKNLIAAMLPREPFSWCLRPDGTHMGLADHATVAGTRLTMCRVAEAFAGTEMRWFVWDGQRLERATSAREADARIDTLAARRFLVEAVRKSTLVGCGMADRRSADTLAIEWERRYGEDFKVTDTWEGR